MTIKHTCAWKVQGVSLERERSRQRGERGGWREHSVSWREQRSYPVNMLVYLRTHARTHAHSHSHYDDSRSHFKYHFQTHSSAKSPYPHAHTHTYTHPIPPPPTHILYLQWSPLTHLAMGLRCVLPNDELCICRCHFEKCNYLSDKADGPVLSGICCASIKSLVLEEKEKKKEEKKRSARTQTGSVDRFLFMSLNIHAQIQAALLQVYCARWKQTQHTLWCKSGLSVFLAFRWMIVLVRTLTTLSRCVGSEPLCLFCDFDWFTQYK